MKIGFVIPINGISGGLYVAYQHAHFLADRGHEVEFIISDESRGIQVTSYPGFRLRTVGLAEAVRSGRAYDVLIATWWETYFEMFRLPAEHRIYFCQSDERLFYPALDPAASFVEQTYRDHGVGIITEARWIREMFQREFGLVAEYAPNGIDTKLFHPGVKPLSPRGARPRLLVEGPGGVPYKRVELAFRVASRFPDAEVWYVSSDGVTRPEWRVDRMFSKLSLQEMPAVYASCDVLIKLSVVEGFFGPPLEMMACGGTAVVSRVNGWDEYIRDGENALVVPLDDEEAAVAALRRLLEDRALRDRLSAEGARTTQAMDWSTRSPLFERAVLAQVARGLKSRLDSSERLADDLRRALVAQERRIERLEDQLYNWKPFRIWQSAKSRVRGRAE